MFSIQEQFTWKFLSIVTFINLRFINNFNTHFELFWDDSWLTHWLLVQLVKLDHNGWVKLFESQMCTSHFLPLAFVMCVWFTSLINPANCSQTFPVERQQKQPQVNQVRTSKQMSPALCTSPGRWRRTAAKVLCNPDSRGLHSKFSPSFSPTDMARHLAHHSNPLQHPRIPASRHPKSRFQHPVTTYFGIWLSTGCQTFKQIKDNLL